MKASKKRFGMVIDLQACMGCDTCTLACKQENNLPTGVWWTQVITVGTNGDSPTHADPAYLRREYLPLACQHCLNAPCVEVCPPAATYRRVEDGLVMQDPSLCIGCRYCMVVCPYTGVRVYSSEEPRFTLPYPTGGNTMIHRGKTVEKCTFCAHLVANGEQPACVSSCPVSCRYFGDLNDPKSDVSELLRSRPHFQLLCEKGTEPSVYYLT